MKRALHVDQPSGFGKPRQFRKSIPHRSGQSHHDAKNEEERERLKYRPEKRTVTIPAQSSGPFSPCIAANELLWSGELFAVSADAAQCS